MLVAYCTRTLIARTSDNRQSTAGESHLRNAIERRALASRARLTHHAYQLDALPLSLTLTTQALSHTQPDAPPPNLHLSNKHIRAIESHYNYLTLREIESVLDQRILTSNRSNKSAAISTLWQMLLIFTNAYKHCRTFRYQ